jgi:hypothetical protein
MVQYIVLVAVVALFGITAFGDFGARAATTVKEQGLNVALLGF